MTQISRIGTNIRKVSFRLSNGEDIAGKVFLSQYRAHHSGPQNVGDLLKESELFFPLKTDTGFILINRSQVVHARLACEEEEDELMRLGAASQGVSVATILREAIEGEVFIKHREGLERVQDHVNETSETFLRLFQSESIIYINQKFIVSIRDAL